MTKIHVAIAMWQWPSYFDPATKMKGIQLDISNWQRPAPDTAPTGAKAAGLYMICTMSKHDAEAKGYADALMFDYRGYVAEATGANIFFVKDGKLHTPIADCFLNGIQASDAARLSGLTTHQIWEWCGWRAVVAPRCSAGWSRPSRSFLMADDPSSTHLK